jgi:oligoribonuclease
MILWLDFETTGLIPDYDVPLEVATVLTDSELNELWAFTCPLKPFRLEPLVKMSGEVAEMHTLTSLFDRIDASGRTLTYAQDQILERIRGMKLPLGGSSVHFDRNFLTNYMPIVMLSVTHRNIDVSTIRQLVEWWYPDGEKFVPTGVKHRALDDIRNSIAELKFYREHYFRDVAW